VIQGMIVIFGILTILFAMSGKQGLRQYAPLVALLGQPFWIASISPLEQWGMMIVTVLYTVVYVDDLMQNLGLW
jgi:hypothetical protein